MKTNIELTIEELELLIEWFDPVQFESLNSPKDDALKLKLDDLLVSAKEKEKLKNKVSKI